MCNCKCDCKRFELTDEQKALIRKTLGANFKWAAELLNSLTKDKPKRRLTDIEDVYP